MPHHSEPAGAQAAAIRRGHRGAPGARDTGDGVDLQRARQPVAGGRIEVIEPEELDDRPE